MNKLIPLIIFLVIGIFLFLSLNSDPKKLPSPLVGKSFPVIEGADFYTNEKVKFKDLMDNQVSLVNVWASWCTTCRKEHQMITNIAKNNDIKLIGINYKDTRLNAENFLSELGNPYEKIIFDQEGIISIEWGAYGVPESFLIKDRIIIKRYIGPLNKKLIEEMRLIIK